MEKNEEILYPTKWRARVSKDNSIYLKFFVQNNKTVDINLPIHQLKQMTQIFREILGRPIGKETKFLKIVYQVHVINSIPYQQQFSTNIVY